jgi:hypothetical protein
VSLARGKKPARDLGSKLEGMYLAFQIARAHASWLVSKRAREERALAAERRMETLKSWFYLPLVSSGDSLSAAFVSSASASSSRLKSEPTTNSDSESDAEPVETDQDRRRTMLESIGEQELDEMKAARYDFSDDFRLPGETGGDSCSIHNIERPEVAVSTDAQPGSSTRPGKHRRVEDEEVSVTKKLRNSGAPRPGKTEDQPNGWNCLVCTLYVFKMRFKSM